MKRSLCGAARKPLALCLCVALCLCCVASAALAASAATPGTQAAAQSDPWGGGLRRTDVPVTGDGQPLALMIALGVVSLAGILLCLHRRAR